MIVTNLKTLDAKDLETKVCVVIGTRPGIVMLSPIIRELERRRLPCLVLHSGQHYSYNMDRQLMEDLELREPDHKLEAVRYAGFHGAQTAEMLKGCEEVFLRERPRLVLVGGDANTNLAGALAARKLHIQVGHVEAGERSYDWRMPEEHNRVLIDHMSEYLFATNEKAQENLVADNVRGRIVITGNPIVDATEQNVAIAQRRSRLIRELSLEADGYFVLTLHREENVDSKDTLMAVLEGMRLVHEEFGRSIVFPAHPRTGRRLTEFGLDRHAREIPGLMTTDALGYLDFLCLLARTELVFTDSGGVQQESCILDVPCVTLRDSTEWTETVELGANRLAGTAPERILHAARAMAGASGGWSNPFGDGKAAYRIADTVSEVLEEADTPSQVGTA
jgi:UDP-N-acetylglucosamine 2-epimerase (non-hydrolysing)